ncbi:MAG: transposase [Candidatus Nitrosopolaris sp.]
MDIGKRNCKACIMNADGSIDEEYDNKLTEAEIFACSMVKKYGECMAVCESTANLWLKTYHAFEKYSIGVKLANPLKTKAIAEAKIKTDTLDARTLAHLLRSDLVAECYISPIQIRENRIGLFFLSLGISVTLFGPAYSAHVIRITRR